MIYCDKCKNHLVQRHVNGRNSDHSFGPFAIDLCARCYNEFRKLVSDWVKNDTWSEVDAQSHSDENHTSWLK
jgi:DNA-directed RNA polymerase subunit M/transcription elongation factor TFIIS